jgi:hypothetical protein
MKCGEGSAVERPKGAYDHILSPTTVFPSELDCALNRFRSAIAEEDLPASTLKSVDRFRDF